MRIGKKKIGSTAMFAIILALYAVLVLIIMGLWNLLIPDITHWSSINFWQALGLAVLCRLLCGTMHHFRGCFPHEHRFGHHHHHGKFHNMSPEEREAFVRRRFQNLVNDETSGKE